MLVIESPSENITRPGTEKKREGGGGGQSKTMPYTVSLQPYWQSRSPVTRGNGTYHCNWMWRGANSSKILVPLSIPRRTARKFACVVVAVSTGVESRSPEPTGLVSSLATANAPPSSVRIWHLTDRHIVLLNAIACVAAVSASCLFFAAIPTLMAFKRAAESLEKLLDVTREELPGTMAAVRLSGMEISDLTMELSDLGQQITEGVRSSTRAVRVAEDGLRRMTSMASVAFLQKQATVQAKMMKPAMARTARSLHDGLVQGCSMLRSLIALSQITSWLSRYWSNRRKHLRDKERASDHGVCY